MSHTLPRFHKVGNGTGDGRLHRPSSLYDNVNREVSVRPLSQELNLSTTVPQNLVRTNLASRHTPTRNSLRHSRMLGMTIGGKLPKKYLPPIIRHYKLSLLLVILQCIIGMSLVILATWLLLLSSSLQLRLVPIWSGGILTVTGYLGLILLRCCPREFPQSRPSIYIWKVIDLMLSSVAVFACLCAAIIAVLHWLQLNTMDCEESTSQDTTTCTCASSIDQVVHEMSCYSVKEELLLMLLVSCGLNIAGMLVSAPLIFILWNSRYSHLYTGLPSVDQSLLFKK